MLRFYCKMQIAIIGALLVLCAALLMVPPSAHVIRGLDWPAVEHASHAGVAVELALAGSALLLLAALAHRRWR